MSLADPRLLVLFALVAVACRFRPRAGMPLLLAASVGAYALSDPAGLVPLLACVALGWVGGIAAARPGGRLAGAGVVGALVLLLVAAKVTALRTGRIPLGISFYVFQIVGYVLDVRAGRLAPEGRPGRFALFALFYPQLVAGPIERGRDLLPQIAAPRAVGWEDVASGATLISAGLLHKVAIADVLGPYADEAFRLDDPPGAIVWAAAAAFGLQLYADLLGYTLLARGTARWFGIELSPNFDRPLLAASPDAFWRRWHTTVSRFFRDHVLVPLLGPAPGAGRTAAAVLATFALVGLWHGLTASHLAFGLWHGAWVLVAIAARRWLVPDAVSASVAGRALGAALTMGGVLLPGALLLRAPDLPAAARWMALSPWAGTADERLVAVMLWGFVLAATGALAGCGAWLTAAERPGRLPARALLWGVAAAACLALPPLAGSDFLYFRF